MAPTPGELTEALWEACADLAGQMATDAEGATKVVRVRVTGAASAADAAAGARKVAESQLVKCSWFGQDPYWGRIVSELGSAGDRLRHRPGPGQLRRHHRLRRRRGRHRLRARAPWPRSWPSASSRCVADLGLGDGEATILTVDLTHAYIDENMRTS